MLNVPKLSNPTLQLFLSAEELWSEGVRPWVEAGRGRIEQSYIVVATRGQAQGLKQRFIEENIPLLGIEFLTPGLARRKWIAGGSSTSRPAMGRELLLFGLRRLIDERCRAAAAEASTRGYWHSLRTDAERALDDWDTLVRAGHRAADWASPLMREIFGDLENWIERMGFEPAAVQERTAVQNLSSEQPTVADRVLVAGLGAEVSGEFWGVAGLALRSAEATVWLPEPDFGGGVTRTQEGWIERWQNLLMVEALPSNSIDHDSAGSGPAALLAPSSDPAPDLTRTGLVVGRSRSDEMEWVADQVAKWLGDGAKRISVIVPIENAAHLRLRQALVRRKIDFIDQLAVSGPPSLDIRLQQAVLEYHAKGRRAEGLLALWPRLLAAGTTTLSQADVRRLLDRSFQKCHRHEVSAHEALWRERESELSRMVVLLGETWPEELPLADALARFRGICERLDLADPESVQSLDTLAKNDEVVCSRELAAESIASLLPQQFPAADGGGKSGFAPVLLGSWRRLVGLEATHLIFTQCNANVWPMKVQESPWWREADRQRFLAENGSDAGLITQAEFREVETAGLRRISRDVASDIVYSAALHEDAEPDTVLAPNAWLERILVAQGLSKQAGGIGPALVQLARTATTSRKTTSAEIRRWSQIEQRRRDPSLPFDEWFYAGDPSITTPDHVSPRLIERAVQDPAEFWYEGVLGVGRIEREDFQRERSLTLGLLAHDFVAKSLQPSHEVAAGFGPLPDARHAQATLAQVFAQWQAVQPKDLYWQTFSAELEAVTQGLLDQALGLDSGEFVATEMWLPAAATLDLKSRKIPLRGRMDLVRSDRAGWVDAQIDIIDFKTGGDIAISARKMGQSGRSLQLGIYLAAARSLGASTSRVWMIKPGANEVSVMSADELDTALAGLEWLDVALARGTIGALTPDRSEYSFAGYDWPRAVRPIAESILRRKFAATFAPPSNEAEVEA
ncbi:MAG: hypothetical protein SynsKO_22340 [Synoicihabitans sp.]